MTPTNLNYSIFRPAGITVGVGLIMSLIAAMGVGCNVGGNATATNPETGDYSARSGPVVEMTYANVPFEEMLTEANVIVAGKIADIGKTMWNQDSGAYWEEVIKDANGETTIHALPYYEVTILPERLLADSLGISDGQLVVTVLGTSPTDHQPTAQDFNLQSGDEIIAFVRQGEIAWWNGKVIYDTETSSFESGRKPVLLFMGNPANSYLLKGQDGLYQLPVTEQQSGPLSLEELMKMISESREAK